MSKVLPFLKKHWLDLGLYLFVVALAVIGLCLLPIFFSSSDSHLLNVNVDGTVTMTIDLSAEDEQREIEVEGAAGPLTIGVKKNAAAILSSPCPEQYCVHMGWVSDGRPIVCAYSHVALLFETNGDIDVIL